jgi:lysozyme
MKMSTRGREALKAREGVRLRAYRCSAGRLTIGIGHTSAAGPPYVTEGMTITAEEADEIFTRDLVKYEKLVNDAVKVPLAQNEFDALVSITYNVENFARQPSTTIKRLNAGDRAGAADAILFWNKPSEIIGRRKTEQKQFLTPYPGMVTKKPPSKSTGPVVAGTAGAGAGAAAQQAGLPWWAVGLIVLGVAVAAYAIWRLKK